MSASGERTPRGLSEDGLTILELMVVLVILSMIGAIATVQVVQQMDRAKVDVALLQLRQLESALELYRIDTRDYPSKEQGLSALLTNPGTVSGWRGPYVKSSSLLRDPWGTSIVFETNADAGVVMRSLGADRRAGGEGVAADIILQL